MKKAKNLNRQKLLKQLLNLDPQLTPAELFQLFPAYQNFQPIKESYGLWTPPKKLEYLRVNSNKHKKIMLLMSGISAGGKDAVRAKIQELNPGLLFKAVTATTRDSRDGERHKKDYYFYDKDRFAEEAKKDKFIEHTVFGSHQYGSPKQSFDDALQRSEPIVCSHVEMKDGWPGVENYFEKEYSGEKPFILKIFVMPHMSFSKYAKKWLPKIRKDWEERLEIAAWEISAAASNADVILTNTILKNNSEPLNRQAREIIKHALKILKPTSSMNPAHSLHR